MRITSAFHTAVALSFLAYAAALTFSGCDNAAPTAGPTPAAAPQNPGPPSGMNPGGPPGMPGAQAPVDETGPFAAGKAVFAKSNCARCHRMGGAAGPGGPAMAGGPGGPPPGGPGPGGPQPGGPQPGGPPPGGPGAGGPPRGGPGPGGFGGPPGGRGPDLSKVGADPQHTVEWLMDYVRDPKSIKPDARMPAFGSRLSDDELRALAEYLASLKE